MSNPQPVAPSPAQPTLWEQREALILSAEQRRQRVPSLTPLPGIKAAVLRLEGKRRVVISVGAKGGVEQGFFFSVTRGPLLVGIVQVVKVEDHHSIGLVRFLTEGAGVEVGDEMRTRFPRLVSKPPILLDPPAGDQLDNDGLALPSLADQELAALRDSGLPSRGELPELDGRISQGPRWEDGLVQISIGSDDGVKVGLVGSIYRGNRWIGQLIVDRAERNNSYGRVTVRRSDLKVKPGDSVTTGLR